MTVEVLDAEKMGDDAMRIGNVVLAIVAKEDFNAAVAALTNVIEVLSGKSPAHTYAAKNQLARAAERLSEQLIAETIRRRRQ